MRTRRSTWAGLPLALVALLAPTFPVGCASTPPPTTEERGEDEGSEDRRTSGWSLVWKVPVWITVGTALVTSTLAADLVTAPFWALGRDDPPFPFTWRLIESAVSSEAEERGPPRLR
jgi:hypothetical protein